MAGLVNNLQEVFVKLTRKNADEPTNLKNLAVTPYFKKVWRKESVCVCHITKIDPSKPFDALSIEV